MNNKTQKKKSKKKIWKEFDIEINSEDSQNNNLECVYEKENSIDQCNICNSFLIVSEHYLLTCFEIVTSSI